MTTTLEFESTLNQKGICDYNTKSQFLEPNINFTKAVLKWNAKIIAHKTGFDYGLEVTSIELSYDYDDKNGDVQTDGQTTWVPKETSLSFESDVVGIKQSSVDIRYIEIDFTNSKVDLWV